MFLKAEREHLVPQREPHIGLTRQTNVWKMAFLF